MNPFLRQVAFHYMAEGDIFSRCFVFPNRRSQVFFMKYLGEAVKEDGCPVVAPKAYTINDFFFRISGVKSADRVDLLLELYDCYRELFPKAESLDEFIFWGDVILSDFDDVDKYLVDPSKLFANVAEFKEIQDSYSYLTETQRKAIESFLTHFRGDGKLTVDLDAEKPGVKERFLQVWNILYPLYRSFREKLESQGKAYEGMVYRTLAERLKEESAVDVLGKPFAGTEKFVFVGLNALNECERTVLKKMRDAGIAEFCWDYSSAMIKDRQNKSSLFMSRNTEDFPSSFNLDDGKLEVPEIEVVSIPSSTGQAKLVPTYVKDGSYAVVLPDESLLVPVLNSIPLEIKDINVTMGYPMKSSAFFDFFNLVSAMQTHLRSKDGKWFFYHNQVWSIFASSVFRRLSAGDDEVAAKVKAVKAGHKFYIPQEDLQGTPLMDLLFQPVVADPKKADTAQIHALEDYQKGLIKGIAEKLSGEQTLAMELEFAKAAYNAITRLQSRNMEILPVTYLKLLNQLLGPVSVPFNGEPLKGLQIMGPLETRSLDFENLIILSCNEGMFPRRSVSSSFIPPELRKGFGLPTYEFQDAVWAYYFYRLIQRAKKVVLVYDSRTEGLKNGEESRYIKQLEYHFGVPVKRRFVMAEAMGTLDPEPIVKTAEDVEIIRGSRLSASAVKNYLDCPAKFYFHTVRKLKKTDEVSEDLDAGMLGNVFHHTMEKLYSGDRFITASHLGEIVKQRSRIKDIVRSEILSELNSLEVQGRDLVVEEVIVEYVLKTIQRDIELLRDAGSDAFEILGLEKEYEQVIDGLTFIGYVDRLDSYLPGEVRVVDYKTGKVEAKDVDIDDGNAADVVSALFGAENKGRPKIAFQLYLYDRFCKSDSAVGGRRLVNTIYPPANLFKEPVRNVPVSQAFMDLTEEKFHQLLAELVSLDVPFGRTGEPETCEICDFRMICGR